MKETQAQVRKAPAGSGPISSPLSSLSFLIQKTETNPYFLLIVRKNTTTTETHNSQLSGSQWGGMSRTPHCPQGDEGIGAQAERVPGQEELGGKKANQPANKGKNVRDTDTSLRVFHTRPSGIRGPALPTAHGGTGEEGTVTTTGPSPELPRARRLARPVSRHLPRPHQESAVPLSTEKGAGSGGAQRLPGPSAGPCGATEPRARPPPASGVGGVVRPPRSVPPKTFYVFLVPSALFL